MNRKMNQLIWNLLPKKSISRLTGRIARHPKSKRLIPSYIRFFNVDMTMVKKEVSEFGNLLDFFVRELRVDARPIDSRTDHIVSPVDGTIGQIGDIHEGTLIQAKGITYSLTKLLGDQQKYVDRFNGGRFATIYLSPRDYHRIHMPVEGSVNELTYIPGQLYPVNQMGLRLITGLFQRNERVVSYIESALGDIAVVKVGATNVGSIKVAFDSTISSNQLGQRSLQHKVYDSGNVLLKGEELGRFEFGSTVILLFEPNQIEWTIDPRPGVVVKMGESIAKALVKGS